MKLLIVILALLVAGSGALCAQGGGGGFFKEDPGRSEFTGRMIVKPLDAETLAARGLSSGAAGLTRQAAAARLDANRIRYEAAADEHIVAVPAGFDENSYAAFLMRTGDYAYVEPDWLCYPDNTPNDPQYNQQWHHPKIQSPQAWDLYTGGMDRIAAWVDTGVDTNHPDLAAHLIPGYNAKDRLTEAQGGSVEDINGHGTIVAGCIGAIGNNAAGVAGMNWSISLLPIKATNRSDGAANMSDLTHGARWAAENGAKTVSVSYSGVSASSVQNAGAYVKSLGGLLLWAAGNDNQNLSGFDHADVIIVGATSSNDSKASFSNYGLAIDVMAPGVSIRSTTLGGGYGSASGTSFSAPITNGLCALIWGFSPNATPAEIEQWLYAGCDDMGNQTNYGFGRVNAYQSILLVGGASPLPDVKINGLDGPLTIPQSDGVEFRISLDPGSLAGVNHDYWISAQFEPPWFNPYWFSYPSSWTQSATPIRAFGGPLTALSNFLIASAAQLPTGYWEFSFAVDAYNNSYEGTYSDTAQVTIF